MALAVIIYASVFLPAKWEQLRTGHWAIEHFLAYFVATWIVWLGWRRPLLVAGGLMIAAVLLEALQSLTPNHTSNFLSVLSGAGGVLAAVLLAEFLLVIGAPRLGNKAASLNCPRRHIRSNSDEPIEQGHEPTSNCSSRVATKELVL